MSAPISEDAAVEVSRLMKLLGHPFRLRIVEALASDGPASPTTLSDRFGACTVGDCNYHLRALERGGLVTIGRSRRVRGAQERIYEIEPRSRWPFQSRLGPLITLIVPATTSAAEPFLIAMPVTLDERGVTDAIAAIRAARTKAARIEAAAQRRLVGADPGDAIAAVLATGLLDAAERPAALAGGPGHAPESRASPV